MDAAIERLARKLGDRELAEKLVAAGLDVPGKIKDAKDGDIKAVPGIGPAGLKSIRKVFPKR